MINRTLKLLVALPLIITIIILVVINVQLNYEPEVVINKNDTVQLEVLSELRGIKNALDENADLKMQRIYPEGYVFLNSVYALTWCSFLSHDSHQKYFTEGHAEIQRAWNKVNSKFAKGSFSEHLPLPHGSFYNGWNSYVLGSKLRLEDINERSNQEQDQFKQQCVRIAEAIEQTTYPQSYHGAAWPADVTICVASLSVHDQIFEPRYHGIIQKWLVNVKSHLDARGMIPHSVHPQTGVVLENARGSSMSLMLIFLRDIDLSFAKQQFSLFKENFVDSEFGLTGIREYPKGFSGAGDIDSGPVILGFGGVSTIVGMKTLSMFEEYELSLKVRNEVETFGIPIQREHQKQYLLGKLPIADAFIAWSHSGMKQRAENVSFLYFHLSSAFITLLLFTCVWFIIRANRRETPTIKKERSE